MKKKILEIIVLVTLICFIISACSEPGSKPEPKLPTLTGTVSISGIAEVGQTLIATTALGGSGMIFYQWKRGSTDIGTNSNTYTVQFVDIGSTISVIVARSGYIGSVTSPPTAIVPPVLTGTVNITGTKEVGQTLTANTDSLVGSGDISYHWKRGTIDIGTNSNTYIIQSADVGSSITVTVTCLGYSGSITSSPITGIGLPPLTGTVSINGTAEIGQILTANTDLLDGSGTIFYQWKNETTNIGTNSDTYTVQSTDAGFTITVTVTRSSNSGSITSTPTVTVPFPVLAGTLTITGSTCVDQILTVNTNDLNGTGDYLYIWKRGDMMEAVNTTITSANNQTYTLTQADVGKYIAVTVSNSRNPGSITSTVVGPIAPEMTVPGEDLAAKLNWLKTNARSDIAYLVTVDKDESLIGASDNNSNNYLSYFGVNIIIRLTGTGGEQTVSSNGSLFIVRQGVKLILDNNITLQGNYRNYSSVVYVNGGILEMKTGAKISGNNKTVSSNDPYDKEEYGGGVTVGSDGTFIMNGGEISGNTSNRGNCAGGGVIVSNKGTFTMNDGEISGNTAKYYGGGVSVQGTFTMNGGKISSNVSDGSGGGVYIDQNAFFTMTGGEISGNTADNNGGGVYMLGDYRIFTMSGGKISGNTSNRGAGGGLFMERGTFIMSGNAVISGNTSNNGGGSHCLGGGVYLSYVSFTMNGGEISGNIASASPLSGALSEAKGGGVFMSDGTFTMSGGKIYGNTASASGNGSSKGGGVCMLYGTIIMSGGKIYGNTTFASGNSPNSNGGGVYMERGTFTMSGGEISGNTASASSPYSFANRAYGGGVYVYVSLDLSVGNKGTFTKSGGGIITGYADDTAEGNMVKENNIVQSNKGHAVYVSVYNSNSYSTSEKCRDNTAEQTDNMDSTIVGTAGGWE